MDADTLRAMLPDTEEELGVWYSDRAMLPNDTAFGHCTSTARYLQELLGVGEVMGFSVADNPTVESELIRTVFGHDFLVVDDRFVVDLWVSMFAGDTDRRVFDLESDDPLIPYYYGNPECWETL